MTAHDRRLLSKFINWQDPGIDASYENLILESFERLCMPHLKNDDNVATLRSFLDGTDQELTIVCGDSNKARHKVNRFRELIRNYGLEHVCYVSKSKNTAVLHKL